MKYILFILIVGIAGCGSPYADPKTSSAINIQKQTELFKQQNELLAQQNQYLKRIAEALEAKGKQ